MKTKQLCILTGIAVALLASAAPRAAVAVCDSCVSHALPTQTTYYAPTAVAQTAYYAPSAVAQTAYYAPATPAYSTYYRPRWWQRWWRTPRTAYYPTTAYYPSTAYAATSYYAPAAVAAPGCSTCAPQVSYQPQTSYKVQIVNKPVTTMQPTTVFDNCTGCARTVMRPVTTYVQEQQYMPTTVYRPVVTGCATGCSTGCATACPANCTGCASCAGGAAVIETVPQAQQQGSGVPTEADRQPELRRKPVPVPDKETDDAGKAKNANGNSFPRLTDPNDRTAKLSTPGVRRVSWSQAAPKSTVAYRQVSDSNRASAK